LRWLASGCAAAAPQQLVSYQTCKLKIRAYTNHTLDQRLSLPPEKDAHAAF